MRRAAVEAEGPQAVATEAEEAWTTPQAVGGLWGPASYCSLIGTVCAASIVGKEGF